MFCTKSHVLAFVYKQYQLVGKGRRFTQFLNLYHGTIILIILDQLLFLNLYHGTIILIILDQLLLLETPRKIMVKILNSRLGNIFSIHSILQPSQFAGLPGGSTMSPINVAKQLIDDARINNKEIWLYL